MIVIGGGNTAIDAAECGGAAGRARRSISFTGGREKEMPAFPFEYDHSKVEGVQFHWLAQPVEVVAGDGRAAGGEVRARRD